MHDQRAAQGWMGQCLAWCREWIGVYDIIVWAIAWAIVSAFAVLLVAWPGLWYWYAGERVSTEQAVPVETPPVRARAYLERLGVPIMGEIVCRDVSLFAGQISYCDASSGSTVITVRCAKTCHVVHGQEP